MTQTFKPVKDQAWQYAEVRTRQQLMGAGTQDAHYAHVIVGVSKTLEGVPNVSAQKGQTMFEDVLNVLGLDGWELAGVVTVGDKSNFFFKRPVRAE